jgi:hypothetical protein
MSMKFELIKNTDKLGEYKTDWSEFKFCKFIGNLILRNE